MCNFLPERSKRHQMGSTGFTAGVLFRRYDTENLVHEARYGCARFASPLEGNIHN